MVPKFLFIREPKPTVDVVPKGGSVPPASVASQQAVADELSSIEVVFGV